MIKSKKERTEYIHRRGRELAESGSYEDWGQIERALRREGFPEARQLLDSQFLRQELNEMYKLAFEKKKAN